MDHDIRAFSSPVHKMKSFFLKAQPNCHHPSTKLQKIEGNREDWRLKRWDAIVNDYKDRMLTNSADLFPAIAGIAEEIERQTGLTYVAGLWKESIRHDLLWKTIPRAEPSTVYKAPSWSWAAAHPLVWTSPYFCDDIFSGRSSNPPAAQVEFIEYSIQHITDSKFSQPTEGSYLTLRSLWSFNDQ